MVTKVIIISNQLAAADIWSESEARSTGLEVEVVGSLEALQRDPSAARPVFVLLGDDVVRMRGLLLDCSLASDHTSSMAGAEVSAEVDEMYASILESSREMLVLLDLEGRIILCNKAFRDIVGMDAREMIGEPLLPFLEEDSAEVLAHIISAAGTGENGMVLELQRPDGGTAALEFISHALNHNGRVYGTQLLGRDISEERKRDSDLVLANKKLVLLGSMTRHDILNKAMILSGYIEMASTDSMGAEGKAALDSAQRVLESVVRILESTRNYQKLGSSDSTWINISKEVSAYAKGKSLSGVEISCSTGDLEVLADPMFVNGLHNLIENSVLHGQHTSRISISAARRGKDMVLRLSDDGVGIPNEEKNRIFNWSHKNRSGHGLHFIREALAITDIEIHEVGVAGEGAVFELVMPRGRFRLNGPGGSTRPRSRRT